MFPVTETYYFRTIIDKNDVVTMTPIPKDVHDDLISWMKISDTSPVLSDTSIQWLSANKLLQQDRPIKLYRGLFFSGNSPDDNPGEDFLGGAKKGDHITVTQSHCSSWTSVIGVANRFSVNSSELTFYRIKNDFLLKSENYFNPVGVVLSKVFLPKEILFNVEKLAKWYGIRGPYGREWEIVVKPFQDTELEIERIYTTEPNTLFNKKLKNYTRMI